MKIFIDGSSGTAGMKLADLVRADDRFELLEIEAIHKKSLSIKKSFYQKADLVVFCLPDKSLINELLLEIPQDVKVLDCSAQFRCHDDWVYGLPELDSKQRERIKEAYRVSNPGCYATAFILLVKPLIEKGLIKKSDLISAFSINGYSAGGKKMIMNYETGKSSGALHSFTAIHKHIPEIIKFTELQKSPVFIPAVGGHREGLVMVVPLDNVNENEVREVYKLRYLKNQNINIVEDNPNVINYSFVECGCEIFVSDNKAALRMSNLNKGAAGAAFENLKLMLNYV